MENKESCWRRVHKIRVKDLLMPNPYVAVMTKNMASTVQKVEMKLLFIPIFFILLRVWSLVLTIIEIEVGYKL